MSRKFGRGLSTNAAAVSSIQEYLLTCFTLRERLTVDGPQSWLVFEHKTARNIRVLYSQAKGLLRLQDARRDVTEYRLDDDAGIVSLLISLEVIKATANEIKKQTRQNAQCKSDSKLIYNPRNLRIWRRIQYSFQSVAKSYWPKAARRSEP